MPRSPRATMTASAAAMISARFVERRARLDLGDDAGARRRRPRAARRRRRRRRTNDSGDVLDAGRRPSCSASSRSSAVGVVSARALRRQVDARAALGASAGLDLGLRADARRLSTTVIEIAPSPRMTRSPTRQIVEQRRVVDLDRPRRRSGRRRARSGQRSRARARRRRPGSCPARIFGPGRSASTPTARPASAATVAHRAPAGRGARPTVPWLRLSRTTSTPASINARRATSGPSQRRPERGHDLRPPAHICLSISDQWNCC